MKSSVDLTRERDFKKSIIGLEGFIIRHITNSKVPWAINNMRLINSDEDLKGEEELNYYNLILTGTKNDRKDKRFHRLLNSSICDCCGNPLERFPWKRPGNWGLCKKCDKNTKEIRICWRTNRTFREG